MALSVAHMSLELVKQIERTKMQHRASIRAQELERIRRVIQRKKDAALIEYFFAFQVFLASAFITAMLNA